MKRTVFVRPRSSRTAVGGSHDGLLVVRVRESAANGRANCGVVAALAKALGVAEWVVRITAGTSSRRKEVEVDGDDSALAVAWELLVADD